MAKTTFTSIQFAKLLTLRGRMTVCNLRFDSAYMVNGLTKFKMFYMHTDGAARNSIHSVHIFSDIFKNNDACQRVKGGFNLLIQHIKTIIVVISDKRGK